MNGHFLSVPLSEAESSYYSSEEDFETCRGRRRGSCSEEPPERKTFPTLVQVHVCVLIVWGVCMYCRSCSSAAAVGKTSNFLLCTFTLAHEHTNRSSKIFPRILASTLR